MSATEHLNLETPDQKNLLQKLGKSKIARIGAASFAAVGLAAGIFEGGKSLVSSANGSEAQVTPVEIVSGDTTGFMADIDGSTGNNPGILYSYIKHLPEAQRPYFVVSGKDGTSFKVNITSEKELAAQTGMQPGDQLTIAGLVARDMFVRSHYGRFQHISTPALEKSDGSVSKENAEAFGQAFYTGPSENAPNLSPYHDGWNIRVAGDSVSVVIPPQPEAIGQ